MIIHDGLRRMFAEQEDVFYYLTMMNENYAQPALPEGAEEGILRGMHRIAGDGGGAGAAARLGHDPARGAGGRRAAARGLRRRGRRLERHLVHRAAPRRPGGRARQPPASDARAARLRTCSRVARRRRRAGRRGDRLPAHAARPDPAVGRRAVHRARHRRLRPQRLPPPRCGGSSRWTATTSPSRRCTRSAATRTPRRRSPSTRSTPRRWPRGGGRHAARGHGPGHRRLRRRPGDRDPRRGRPDTSPRRSRSSSSSPTRPRWRCRRRSPASSPS